MLVYTRTNARDGKGADMGEKILEIEGITKKYKDFKLEPVSFSLEAGRLMSVMGAYGAGKTTLFKLLTGQLRMDEGNVIFFEKGERCWNTAGLFLRRAVSRTA